MVLKYFKKKSAKKLLFILNGREKKTSIQAKLMNKSTVSFLFFLFLVSSPVFSQSKKNTEVEKSGGFIVLDLKTDISSADKEKIESANFDEYRLYSIRKKVQVLRGPLIELLSIKEMEEQGKTFSASFIEEAKSKTNSAAHQSIATIDLRIGIKNTKLPEQK